MSEIGKPFVCTEPGCDMTFTNEDHLAVHSNRHKMSLTLSPGLKPGSLLMFTDQTPTPTKFLRNCEEIGLFNELKANPFEEAFKKASDSGPTDGKHVDPSQMAALLHNKKAFVRAMSAIASAAPIPPSQLLEQSAPLPGPDKDVGSSVDSTPENNSTPEIDNITMKSDVKPAKRPHVTTVNVKTGTDMGQGAISLVKERPVAPSTVTTSAPVTSPDIPMTTTTAETPPAPEKQSPTPVSMVTVLESPPLVVKSTPPPSGPTPTGLVDTMAGGESCVIQVMLQMPNGDFVPVQIPGGSSPVLAHQVSPPVVSATRGALQTNAMSLTKQRLKAALQQGSGKRQTTPAQRQTLLKNAPLAHAPTPPPPAPTPPPVPSITVTPPVICLAPPTPPHVQVQDIGTSTPAKKRRQVSTESEDDDRGGPGGGGDERRKKFLERNRAAAMRCREKKKIWMCGLELKAEELQKTNSRLQNEVMRLRNEVADLKSLLLAHKNCPITLQQNAAKREMASPSHSVAMETDAGMSIITVEEGLPEATPPIIVITTATGQTNDDLQR